MSHVKSSEQDAFLDALADLFGPLKTSEPGREKTTRANPSLPHKVRAMVLVCMLSRAVNIQVVEGYPAWVTASQDSDLRPLNQPDSSLTRTWPSYTC